MKINGKSKMLLFVVVLLFSNISLHAIECSSLSINRLYSDKLTKTHWIGDRLYLEANKPEVLDYSRFRFTKDLIGKPQVLRMSEDLLVSSAADLTGNRNLQLILWKRNSEGKFSEVDTAGVSFRLSSAISESYNQMVEATVNKLAPLSAKQSPNWNWQAFLKLSLIAPVASSKMAYQKVIIELKKIFSENSELLHSSHNHKIIPMDNRHFALSRNTVDELGASILLLEVYRVKSGKIVKLDEMIIPEKRYDYSAKSIYLAEGKILSLGFDKRKKVDLLNVAELKESSFDYKEYSLPMEYGRSDLKKVGPSDVLVKKSSDSSLFEWVQFINKGKKSFKIFELDNSENVVLDALVAKNLRRIQLIGNYVNTWTKGSPFLSIPRIEADREVYLFLQNGVIQTRKPIQEQLKLVEAHSIVHEIVSGLKPQGEVNEVGFRKALKNSLSAKGKQRFYRFGEKIVLLTESDVFSQRFYIAINLAASGKLKSIELSMLESIKGPEDYVLDLKIDETGSIYTTKAYQLN